MQARFPGTCRDCGNRFPAGTDIHYDRRTKKASCCNGSPQVDKVDRAFIVNGAQRMEWVDGKTTQEVVGFQGDSLIYEQKEYSGYSWMCLGCRLVWERQHQAINCEKRDHVASFEQSYGGTVWDGRGFTPHGLVAGKYLPGTGTVYVRTAIRREESKDTPPVAPAPVPQVEEPAPQADPQESALTCEYCECSRQEIAHDELHLKGQCASCTGDNYKFEFQDMTSHEMWESIPSVTHPTITDTWN